MFKFRMVFSSLSASIVLLSDFIFKCPSMLVHFCLIAIFSHCWQITTFIKTWHWNLIDAKHWNRYDDKIESRWKKFDVTFFSSFCILIFVNPPYANDQISCCCCCHCCPKIVSPHWLDGYVKLPIKSGDSV